MNVLHWFTNALTVVGNVHVHWVITVPGGLLKVQIELDLHLGWQKRWQKFPLKPIFIGCHPKVNENRLDFSLF